MKDTQSFFQIKLRLPLEMRDCSKDKAQRNFRSMNIEIASCLEMFRQVEQQKGAQQ